MKLNPNEAKQYLDMIGQSFDALAAKLGMAASSVMPYLIRQAWVDAINNTIFSLVALAGGCGLMFAGYLSIKKDDNDCGVYYFFGFGGVVIGGILVLCGLIGFICAMQALVQVAVNPEWAGLLQIKNLFPATS
jgi:hypothetical protein